MKKLLILFFTVISVVVAAQDPKLPVDSKTKKITYKGEVNIGHEVKMPAVFTRSKNWGDAKKLKEKELRKDIGVYAATGSFHVEYPGNVKNQIEKGEILYTITITAADGKYSYIVTDLIHKGHSSKVDGGPLEAAKPKAGIYVLPVTSWNIIKKEADVQVNKLIADLKLAMEGKKAGN